MRDSRARAALVGMILALPILMVGMSPGTTSVRGAVLPLLATEAVLVVGLSGAARERQRLLAEREAPTRRLAVPSAPHATRVVRRATAVR